MLLPVFIYLPATSRYIFKCTDRCAASQKRHCHANDVRWDFDDAAQQLKLAQRDTSTLVYFLDDADAFMHS